MVMNDTQNKKPVKKTVMFLNQIKGEKIKQKKKKKSNRKGGEMWRRKRQSEKEKKEMLMDEVCYQERLRWMRV